MVSSIERANAKTAGDKMLVPSLQQKNNSLEPKARFMDRIERGDCSLSDDECAVRHAGSCRKALHKSRGTLYLYQKVFDPRLGGLRPCCSTEAYWYLINDPRSEYSLNYKKKDAITFEEMVMRFCVYCFKNDPTWTKTVKEAGKGFNCQVHHTDIVNVPPFDDDWDNEYFNRLVSDDPKPKKVVKKKEAPKEEWPEEFPELIQDGFVLPPASPVSKESVKAIKGKPAKITEVVRWVFDNLPVANFDKKTCPSPAAIAMLQWARKD